MTTVDSGAWLEKVNADGVAAFAATDLPDGREEVWRYTRITDVDFGRYSPPAADAGGSVDAQLIDGAAATVVIRNGRIVSIDTTSALGKATVSAVVDASDGDALLNSVRGEPIDAISHLHDAYIDGVVAIDVPRGVHVEAPIVIDVYSDVDGGLTCPHTVVRAAQGSSVAVFERHRSGDADQLVVPMVELDAAPDARIGYLIAQQLGNATTSLGHQVARADQQAHVVCSTAAFGGSYARVRADFRLVGRGASGDLLSAYFGDGDQMLDFRTFQDHDAPDTTSNLLFKGAVTGQAQSVYSGLIRVSEDAPGTNAFQTNRNLKLSDDAWAYSVPNLEIEQNQVACSHASTVGEIDEEQRYYLESRGVPTTIAEQLLVSGFFAEVIAMMPIDAVKAEIQGIIDDALAADRAAQEAS